MEIITLVVGELEVNCYLVGDAKKNEWLIIDPGGEGKEILETIAGKKAGIKFIVNTHGHPDHTSANNVIKKETGAPLYIHKADASFLSGLFTTMARLSGIKGASSKPDCFLKEGDTVSIGDISFKVIHTPGHTPGGICLYARGVLFSGDTLFAASIGRTDLPGGSLDNLLNSIKDKLFSLPDETMVYPGHGPRTSIAEEKNSNPFFI